MNREMAIDWARSMFPKASLWPNGTKADFPNGWRWVVSRLPYQNPEYKLVNSMQSEITKGDVYL